MLRRVGTLKTYSSLEVLVTMKRPLSAGGRSSAPGFSTTPKGAYMPPPMLTPLWQAEQPLFMNRASPDFCAGESASASPLRKRSNGAPGVISVASKTAIAFSTLASVTGSGSPGKALAKGSRYPGIPFSCSATWASGEAISTGLTIGPPACCSRSLARPSQNWALLNTALRTVGALRAPCCQRCPMDGDCVSAPPSPRLWQELQLMIWLADSRGSKKSIFPSSTLAGVAGLPGQLGWRRRDRLELLPRSSHQIVLR